MILFYSGDASRGCLPEEVLVDEPNPPDLMISKGTRVILFYSGCASRGCFPEEVLVDDGGPPALMLTYFDIEKREGGAAVRLRHHITRRQGQKNEGRQGTSATKS